MAAQAPSPFTNTRLMLAGVICGVVAALMGYMHLHKIEKEKVGEKVTIYYVTQRVSTDQPLMRNFLETFEVPEAFYKKVPTLVTEGSLNLFDKRTPARTLYPGEPLLATAFETGTETISLPDVPAGSKQRTVRVDSRRSPGQGLDVGAIVSLTANFRLGADPNDKKEMRPLRLLEHVQVRLINGLSHPTDRERKSITSITVFIGDETSEWLTYLEGARMEGEFTIEGDAPGTRAASPNEEIPRDVKDLLQTKFPGVVTISR